MGYSAAQVRKLFADYQKATDPSLRQAIRSLLVENFLYVVEHHAKRVWSKSGGLAELDDLIQDGNVGLMEAIDSYEADRGVVFVTFAVPRIRGAIIDGVRGRDWVPRIVRARTKHINNLINKASSQTGVRPSDEELIALVGGDKKVIRDGHAVSTSSLGTVIKNGESRDQVLEDTIQAPRQEEYDPDMSIRMRRLVTGFNETERAIFLQYFYKHMTMDHIARTTMSTKGKTSGKFLTESRVSQIMTSLLERIKADPVKMKYLLEAA